jgi:bifunctional DNase/RNase
VAGIAPTPHGSAALLLEQESQRIVPIFVGSTEALVIELRLEHRRYGRPLTHDLLDSVLHEVGGTVDSVRVDKLVGGVFHATVVLRYEGKMRELDARSSDAVAIALGHGTPIFVQRAVLVEAGVSLESVKAPGASDGGTWHPNSIEDGPGAVTL